MGSLTRRLLVKSWDRLINQQLSSGSNEVMTPDCATAKRVSARLKKRGFDLDKVKVKYVQENNTFTYNHKKHRGERESNLR